MMQIRCKRGLKASSSGGRNKAVYNEDPNKKALARNRTNRYES